MEELPGQAAPGPHRSHGQESLGTPCHSRVAPCRQVDGVKRPSTEDGLQVLAIDGHQGHVLNHATFQNVILQGVPWQLLEHIAALPDK